MNRNKWMLGGAAAIALLVWPCFGSPVLTAPQVPDWTLTIVTIASPTGANGGEPQPDHSSNHAT